MGDVAEGWVERCPVTVKCLQNLGLGLTPGSKEVHEQVSP